MYGTSRITRRLSRRWSLIAPLLITLLMAGASSTLARSDVTQPPDTELFSEAGAPFEQEKPPTPPPPDDQQSTSGPEPPAGLARGGAEAAGGAGTAIPGVPAYTWYRGCGPTAAGMVIGYWDGRGYDIVPGNAASQTPAVNNMIASSGHYDDYSQPIDTSPSPILPDRSEPPPGDEHPHDSVADFMRTSWSARSNRYGWSWLSDLTNSMVWYVESVRPDLDASAEYYTFDQFTWEQYKAEINAGRPMVLLVDSGGNDATDHFVTAIGYDDSTGVRYYAIYDTWDRSIHWHPWAKMAWGQTWGIYSVTTFDLRPAQPPPANDRIESAKTITSLPYNDSMDTTWATAAASDPLLPCVSANRGFHTVWYRLQPPVNGVAVINTSGSNYDTILAVWRGSPGSLTPIACNDDSVGLQSQLSFTAEMGRTYYIEVAGYNGGSSGTLNLNLISYDTSVFADVPVPGKEWMEPWIEQLYAEDVTGGCGQNPLRYCPENPVTRGQIAAFLLRAKYEADYVPPAVSGTFSDVPTPGKEWAEPWIEQLYSEGITTGCGQNPLRYCPDRPVTRGEMAVFILRTFDHLPKP